jgi:Transposase domain (DUF772)
MRGADSKQEGMFSYVSPESRIPTNHPLRPIRAIVAEALTQMDRKLESLYSQNGRPSIAPERLIRALLLQVLYTIRSERMLVEQLEYNDAKVKQYKDGWGTRAELLAYSRWGLPFSDQETGAEEYLIARMPGGIFSRGWIYELTARRIVARAP